MKLPRRVLATAPAGLDMAPFVPNLVTVPNVEIIEVGEDWETSTGTFTFDEEDLVSAVESQQDPAVRTPVLKLGHTDPRAGFDGEPSFGRLENMRLTNNGQTVVADLVGVPQWLASIMWSAYPRRSFEGQCNYRTRTGNDWPLTVEALSLLGAAYPAINTLEDLKTLWGAMPPVLLPSGDTEHIAASDGGKIYARKVNDVKWRRLVGGGSGASGMSADVTAGTGGQGGMSGSVFTVPVKAGATTFGDLPLADRERAWSKSSADTAVRAWASSDGSGDTDKIDWTKYRKAFFWYDAGAADQFGSYKLMFADVIDGTLTAIPRGIFAAAGAMNGARGGVDIPSDDETPVKNLIARYYTKMSKEFDDNTITPPWEVNSSMPNKSKSVRASSSLDDMRMAFYDSLDAHQMWWWIRQVLINPLQLVVDDDEGGLYVVDVTAASDGTFTFGEPQSVKVEYVAAAKANGMAAKGQLIASSFASADDSGARPRATIPTEDADASAQTPEEEQDDMKLTPEALAALGLKADATDAEISAAIIAKGQQTPDGDDGAESGNDTGTAPEPEPTPDPEPAPNSQLQVPEGMQLVDTEQWAEVQQEIAASRSRREADASAERDRLIGDAVKAGKFPRSRVEHYTNLYNSDPEGTKQVLSSLAPGVIPVHERGIAPADNGGSGAADNAYPDSWKPSVAASSARVRVSNRVKAGND